VSFFPYRDGRMYVEDVALDDLAEAVGTPFYVYSSAAMIAAYDRFAGALTNALAGRAKPLVCYALKANPNLAVVRTLAARGAGGDVVSEGELRRALAAGIPPEKIVFAGVGKTRAEIAFAIEQGIHQFNAEGLPELDDIDAVARERGVLAPVVLRINPDVHARTHHKITTGRAENKFGIAVDQVPQALERLRGLPNVALKGLAVHIGSQVFELSPFRDAFTRLAELYRELQAQGWPLERLDLGGGLGIAYHDEPPPDVEAYARVVAETVGDLGAELAFEPGRHIVGNAGLLVARTLYVKHGESRSFLVVDAAMNDLIRPTLYDAWHDIVPVHAPAQDTPTRRFEVVGPVCETGDTFASDRALPEVETGDLLAFFSAGAYGATMSSTYNSRRPAPEVLVSGADCAVVRVRPSHEELMAQEPVPDWLKAPTRTAAGGAG
jgi:diaminopimelate decarboxylase